VYKEFEEGLRGIEKFQHLAILFLFHKSKENYQLTQRPRNTNEPRGVFTTGSPLRPNPIGLSVLKLVNVKDNVLRVKWLDMIDGTPILDIKPFHVSEIEKKLWPVNTSGKNH